MMRALRLEEFGVGGAPAAPALTAPEAGTDRSAAPGDAVAEHFDRGYRAGWDDRERALQDERRLLSAELARNLQELSFTYHEARAHVVAGIEPLLRALVERVLPATVARSLGEAVVQEMTAMAELAADEPVSILVSPASHDQVAEFLSATTALPYRLRAEETLGAWQVCFRLGEHERLLDLDGMILRIGTHIAAFFDQTQKELAHG